MSTDNGRVRVLRDHPDVLGKNVFVLGKIPAIKAPIRMSLNLHPTFVEAVNGLKKSRRIGRVNENGNVQIGAFVPDKIQPRIVHRNNFVR